MTRPTEKIATYSSYSISSPISPPSPPSPPASLTDFITYGGDYFASSPEGRGRSSSKVRHSIAPVISDCLYHSSAPVHRSTLSYRVIHPATSSLAAHSRAGYVDAP